MSRRRLTFTFSRTDVATAVEREALLRGCDSQAVINEVLVRHFVERREQQLAEQLTLMQHVVQRLTVGVSQASPEPSPMPVAIPVPVPVPTIKTARRGNPWEE